jgi:hypothetical protein
MCFVVGKSMLLARHLLVVVNGSLQGNIFRLHTIFSPFIFLLVILNFTVALQFMDSAIVLSMCMTVCCNSLL